jgi:hypothetical protein
MNQDASYSNHLKDISRMQKNKIEEMFRHHQLEKDEIEAQKQALMKELDSITKEHAEKRAMTEQEIWDNID